MKVSTRENLQDAIESFYKATLWIGPPLALLLVILSEALGWNTYWAVATILAIYCAPIAALGLIATTAMAGLMVARCWALLGRTFQA